MNARLRILFVCNHANACVRFQKSLERERCQLLFAANREKAAKTLLSASGVDAILIHHNDLLRGSTIASGLKLIRPSLPVFLLTASWPSTGALPLGIDAVCYAATLNRRVAYDVTRFIRRLLTETPRRMLDEPELGHRLTPRGSNYLN